MVKQLLQGNKNLKSLADPGLNDLKSLRSNLHRLGMSQRGTVLLWFSTVAMFYGSCRVHEISFLAAIAAL